MSAPAARPLRCVLMLAYPFPPRSPGRRIRGGVLHRACQRRAPGLRGLTALHLQRSRNTVPAFHARVLLERHTPERMAPLKNCAPQSGGGGIAGRGVAMIACGGHCSTPRPPGERTIFGPCGRRCGRRFSLLRRKFFGRRCRTQFAQTPNRPEKHHDKLHSRTAAHPLETPRASVLALHHRFSLALHASLQRGHSPGRAPLSCAHGGASWWRRTTRTSPSGRATGWTM